MLEKIRKKIGRFILKKKFLKQSLQPINFKEIFNDSKTFLLVLPQDGNDIYDANIIFDYLLTKNKNLTFVVLNKFKETLSKYENSTIIAYNETSKTKFYLPNKNFLNILSKMNYDVVINLNRNEDIFSSAISNVVNSKVRLGFKKENSEHYYNFLVENNSTDGKSNFNNLLNILKMF